FPIVEINRLAVPERNSFKPIYQMHKWFARRASCVFRAILLGCLKPLPVDEHGNPTKSGAEVAYIARLKLNLSKKMAAAETTHWALESDEDADDAVYAEASIPDEAEKVRQLLKVVPEGTDRKFHTLVRAVEQLRRENADERFVIFTQYRETLLFLAEELGKLYGHRKIATIKGGPLADKIAAVESFWQEDGAKFLIATSAGGEGINLQVCRVLFNYDLPWNPMAVEQRIGRIHRYGQRDTVQVYNLVAEDTVEQEIYLLLEAKLLDIARTIGRVDSATGEVTEDFRTEILGCLGSSPNYQDLYKKALVDRDYARTARELEEMMAKARTASEALRELAQDLDTFNIESYRALQGDFNLKDIEAFALKAIPRLGGAVVPEGEFWRIVTPEALHGKPNVAAVYENASFDRALSMRRRKAELLGLGHPLIDALIAHCESPRLHGSVAALQTQGTSRPAVSVRCIFHLDLENGKKQRVYRHVMLATDGELRETKPRLDVDLLQQAQPVAHAAMLDWTTIREQVEQCLHTIEADLRASHDGVLAVRRATVGVAMLGTSRGGPT
ncbi:MAG TPA: helicase-related protein, partial [Planctomycetota bacterium]|nr:helicase-related protein [Planctomycetota bacterium]